MSTLNSTADPLDESPEAHASDMSVAKKLACERTTCGVVSEAVVNQSVTLDSESSRALRILPHLVQRYLDINMTRAKHNCRIATLAPEV